MKRWFSQLLRGQVPGAFVLAGITTFVAAQLVSHDASRRGVAYSAAEGLTHAEGEALVSHAVGALDGSSAHHLRIANGVAGHYHVAHDETVFILSGTGVFTMAEETHSIGPGSVLLIPRGTVHALAVTEGPMEALSVFAPEFDGKDRVFVD